MSGDGHTWWISEFPSVIDPVFRCNCGETLSGTKNILAFMNANEARIEELEDAHDWWRAKAGEHKASVHKLESTIERIWADADIFDTLEDANDALENVLDICREVLEP